MRTLERESADALLDARSVSPASEVFTVPPQEDDDAVFGGFIGMLVGVAVCLPVWAALAVALILILR